MKNFTIPEIRVFLAENLPYFESEDKDEFLYIAKAEDIEKLSKALYAEFHNCEESAISVGGLEDENFCCGCPLEHDPTCEQFMCDDHQQKKETRTNGTI